MNKNIKFIQDFLNEFFGNEKEKTLNYVDKDAFSTNRQNNDNFFLISTYVTEKNSFEKLDDFHDEYPFLKLRKNIKLMK